MGITVPGGLQQRAPSTLVISRDVTRSYFFLNGLLLLVHLSGAFR